MKSTPFLLYILYDIFGEHEPISARAMMGAYVLYYEGKAFALVEKEELYFKGSKELLVWYLEKESRQFTYTKEGKNAHLYYFLVPSEVYENKDTREEWLATALTVAKTPRAKK